MALILRPGPATTVKLLYGEAFRSPNAYELYYSDGYSMKGNPGLDAETIRSAEVVLEQALGERLRASVSLYRWTIDGLIDQTLDPADGLLIFRNLAHAEARGAEAEVRFRIPRRPEARLGYSYGHAEDADTGERLSNSPRQLGFVKANLPLVADLVDLGVEARYIGERRTVRGGSVGAAFPVGLTLTAGGGSRWWEASVGVTNLFDAGYESPVGPEHLQDSVAQDGRSIRVALTTRF